MQHDIGFATFKLLASTKRSFKTDPLNIIFEDFSIWLLKAIRSGSVGYIFHKDILS